MDPNNKNIAETPQRGGEDNYHQDVNSSTLSTASRQDRIERGKQLLSERRSRSHSGGGRNGTNNVSQQVGDVSGIDHDTSVQSNLYGNTSILNDPLRVQKIERGKQIVSARSTPANTPARPTPADDNDEEDDFSAVENSFINTATEDDHHVTTQTTATTTAEEAPVPTHPVTVVAHTMEGTVGDWAQLIPPTADPTAAGTAATLSPREGDHKMLLEQLEYVSSMAQEYHLRSDSWEAKCDSLEKELQNSREERGILNEQLQAANVKSVEQEKEIMALAERLRDSQTQADHRDEQVRQYIVTIDSLQELLAAKSDNDGASPTSQQSAKAVTGGRQSPTDGAFDSDQEIITLNQEKAELQKTLDQQQEIIDNLQQSWQKMATEVRDKENDLEQKLIDSRELNNKLEEQLRAFIDGSTAAGKPTDATTFDAEKSNTMMATSTTSATADLPFAEITDITAFIQQQQQSSSTGEDFAVWADDAQKAIVSRGTIKEYLAAYNEQYKTAWEDMTKYYTNEMTTRDASIITLQEQLAGAATSEPVMVTTSSEDADAMLLQVSDENRLLKEKLRDLSSAEAKLQTLQDELNTARRELDNAQLAAETSTQEAHRAADISKQLQEENESLNSRIEKLLELNQAMQEVAAQKPQGGEEDNVKAATAVLEANFKQELRDLKDKIRSLQESLDEKDQETISFYEDRHDLENKLALAEKHIGNVTSHYETREAEMNSLHQEQIKDLERRIADSEATIANFNTADKDNVAREAELEAKLKTAQLKVIEAQFTIEDQHTDIDRLRHDVAKLEQDIVGLKDSMPEKKKDGEASVLDSDKDPFDDLYNSDDEKTAALKSKTDSVAVTAPVVLENSNEVEELNAALVVKEKEIDDLRSQLATSEGIMNSLREDLETTTQKQQESEEAARKYSSQVAQLQGQLDAGAFMDDERDANADDSLAQITELTQALQRTKESLVEAQQSIALQDDELFDLQQQIIELKEENSALEAAISEAANQAVVKGGVAEPVTTNTQQEPNVASIADAERILELESNLAEMKITIDRLQQDLETANSDSETKISQIQDLNAAIEEFKNALHDLEVISATKDSELSGLAERLAASQERMIDLEKSLAEANTTNNYDEIVSELTEKNKQIEELTNQLQRSKQECDALLESNQDVSAECTSLRNDIATKEASLTSTTSTIVEMSDRIASLESTISNLTTQIDTLIIEKANAELEVTSLKDQINKSQENATGAQSKLGEIWAECTRLSEEVASKDKAMESLTRSLEASKAASEGKSDAHVESLLQDIENLKAEHAAALEAAETDREEACKEAQQEVIDHYEAEIDNVNAQFRAEVARLEVVSAETLARHEEEKATLVAAHNDEIATLTAQHKTAISEAADKLRAEMRDEQDAHVDEKLQVLQSKISQMEEDHKIHLEAATPDIALINQQWELKIASLLEDKIQQHRQELEETRKQFEDDQAQLIESHKNKLEGICEEAANEQILAATHKRFLETELEEAQRTVEELRTEMSKKPSDDLVAELDALRAAHSSTQSELSKANTNHAEERVAWGKERQQLLSRVSEVEKARHTIVERLKQDLVAKEMYMAAHLRRLATTVAATAAKSMEPRPAGHNSVSRVSRSESEDHHHGDDQMAHHVSNNNTNNSATRFSDLRKSMMPVEGDVLMTSPQPLTPARDHSNTAQVSPDPHVHDDDDAIHLEVNGSVHELVEHEMDRLDDAFDNIFTDNDRLRDERDDLSNEVYNLRKEIQRMSQAVQDAELQFKHRLDPNEGRTLQLNLDTVPHHSAVSDRTPPQTARHVSFSPASEASRPVNGNSVDGSSLVGNVSPTLRSALEREIASLRAQLREQEALTKTIRTEHKKEMERMWEEQENVVHAVEKEVAETKVALEIQILEKKKYDEKYMSKVDECERLHRRLTKLIDGAGEMMGGGDGGRRGSVSLIASPIPHSRSKSAVHGERLTSLSIASGRSASCPASPNQRKLEREKERKRRLRVMSDSPSSSTPLSCKNNADDNESSNSDFEEIRSTVSSSAQAFAVASNALGNTMTGTEGKKKKHKKERDPKALRKENRELRKQLSQLDIATSELQRTLTDQSNLLRQQEYSIRNRSASIANHQYPSSSVARSSSVAANGGGGGDLSVALDTLQRQFESAMSEKDHAVRDRDALSTECKSLKQWLETKERTLKRLQEELGREQDALVAAEKKRVEHEMNAMKAQEETHALQQRLDLLRQDAKTANAETEDFYEARSDLQRHSEDLFAEKARVSFELLSSMMSTQTRYIATSCRRVNEQARESAMEEVDALRAIIAEREQELNARDVEFRDLNEDFSRSSVQIQELTQLVSEYDNTQKELMEITIPNRDKQLHEADEKLAQQHKDAQDRLQAVEDAHKATLRRGEEEQERLRKRLGEMEEEVAKYVGDAQALQAARDSQDIESRRRHDEALERLKTEKDRERADLASNHDKELAHRQAEIERLQQDIVSLKAKAAQDAASLQQEAKEYQAKMERQFEERQKAQDAQGKEDRRAAVEAAIAKELVLSDKQQQYAADIFAMKESQLIEEITRLKSAVEDEKRRFLSAYDSAEKLKTARDDEVRRLQEKVTAQEAEIRRLLEVNRNHDRDQEKLFATQMSEKEKEIARLSSELASLEKQRQQDVITATEKQHQLENKLLEDAKREQDGFGRKQRQLEEEIRAFEDQIKDLKTQHKEEIAARETANSALLQNAKSEVDARQRDVDRIQDYLSKSEAALAKTTQDLTEQRNKLADLALANERERSRSESLHDALGRERDQVDMVNNELETARNAILDNEQVIESLERQIGELNGVIAVKDCALSDADRERQQIHLDFQSKLHGKQSDFAKKEGELHRQHQTELESLEKRFKSDITDRQDEHELLMIRIREAADSRQNELNQLLGEKDEEIAELKEDYAALKNKHQAAKQTFEKQAKAQQEDLAKKREALQEEKRASVAHLEALLDSERESTHALREQCAAMQQELDEKVMEIRDIASEMDRRAEQHAADVEQINSVRIIVADTASSLLQRHQTAVRHVKKASGGADHSAAPFPLNHLIHSTSPSSNSNIPRDLADMVDFLMQQLSQQRRTAQLLEGDMDHVEALEEAINNHHEVTASVESIIQQVQDSSLPRLQDMLSRVSGTINSLPRSSLQENPLHSAAATIHAHIQIASQFISTQVSTGERCLHSARFATVSARSQLSQARDQLEQTQATAVTLDTATQRNSGGGRSGDVGTMGILNSARQSLATTTAHTTASLQHQTTQLRALREDLELWQSRFSSTNTTVTTCASSPSTSGGDGRSVSQLRSSDSESDALFITLGALATLLLHTPSSSGGSRFSSSGLRDFHSVDTHYNAPAHELVDFIFSGAFAHLRSPSSSTGRDRSLTQPSRGAGRAILDLRSTIATPRPSIPVLRNGSGSSSVTAIEGSFTTPNSIRVHPILSDLKAITASLVRSDDDLLHHQRQYPHSPQPADPTPSASTTSRRDRPVNSGVRRGTASQQQRGGNASVTSAYRQTPQDDFVRDDDTDSPFEDESSDESDNSGGGAGASSGAENNRVSLKLKRENKRLYGLVRNLTTKLREGVVQAQRGAETTTATSPSDKKRPSRPSTAKERRAVERSAFDFLATFDDVRPRDTTAMAASTSGGQPPTSTVQTSAGGGFRHSQYPPQSSGGNNSFVSPTHQPFQSGNTPRSSTSYQYQQQSSVTHIQRTYSNASSNGGGGAGGSSGFPFTAEPSTNTFRHSTADVIPARAAAIARQLGIDNSPAFRQPPPQ